MPHHAQAAVTHRGAARAKDADLGETGPWEQPWTETAGEARPEPEACPGQGGRERDWAPWGRTGIWHQDTRKRRTGTPSCWGQRAWDPAALSKSPEVTWSARRRQGGARARPRPSAGLTRSAEAWPPTQSQQGWWPGPTGPHAQALLTHRCQEQSGPGHMPSPCWPHLTY